MAGLGIAHSNAMAHRGSGLLSRCNAPTIVSNSCFGPFERRQFRVQKNLAVGLKCRPSLAATRASVAVQEKATGVSFPPKFTVPGSSRELTLLGTGVREKKIAVIAVKVYAVAFYIDLDATAPTWKGRAETELAADQSFFDSLAAAPSDKSLILTLVRNVTTEQFVNALREELAPKLEDQAADVAIIDQLATLFQGRPLRKNSAVLLSWQQPSSLSVSFVDDVTGEYVPSLPPTTIDSLPLLKALFDIYLGKGPIAPSLITSIAATAASL